MARTNRFGQYFKAKRIDLGMTLRRFCLENGLDSGNISKLERGLLPPPHGRKLEEYARLLGLEKGGDDWYEFFDLAAADSGRIPKELLSDEELVEKLPILFRTLRGQKVPEEKLNELIEKIRGA